MQADADRKQHFGIRKFSIGVASVLLSTTLYFAGTSITSNNVQAATEENAETAQQNVPATDHTEGVKSEDPSNDQVQNGGGNTALC